MRKKIRTLVVGQTNYAWAVTETEWPHGQLKVWKGADKNQLWLCADTAVDTAITPADVRRLILDHQAREAGL